MAKEILKEDVLRVGIFDGMIGINQKYENLINDNDFNPIEVNELLKKYEKEIQEEILKIYI